MEEENHYELALGTDSRSFDQWDVWNAVFSPQGYNGYPLDPWDKVYGTIDHDTTALWADQLDLTEYLRTHWGGTRDLGAALKDRVHVSVGTLDNYYLNGGVEQFKKTVDELGGSDWADIDIVPGGNHGGFYDYKSLNDQLDLMWDWFETHSPDGAEPLTAADTAPSTEGNLFSDILKWGGRQAAVDRQGTPQVDLASATVGDTVTADFGAWDPGMALVGQWTLDGQPVGDPIDLGDPHPRGHAVAERLGHAGRGGQRSEPGAHGRSGGADRRGRRAAVAVLVGGGLILLVRRRARQRA